MNHSAPAPPPGTWSRAAAYASVRMTRSTPSPPMPARRSHRARTRAGSRTPCTLPSWSGSSTKSFSVPWPLRKAYAGSAIEALGVVLGAVVVVELVDGHAVGLHLAGDHRAARHLGLRVPGLGLPQPRAQEGLGAVEEQVVDLDDHREQRAVPLDLHLVEERRVAHQPGAAVDAQRVAAARDEEVQADVGVLEDVAVAVGAAVPRPLRERDGPLVEDVHELPGRVALRR